MYTQIMTFWRGMIKRNGLSNVVYNYIFKYCTEVNFDSSNWLLHIKNTIESIGTFCYNNGLTIETNWQIEYPLRISSSKLSL